MLHINVLSYCYFFKWVSKERVCGKCDKDVGFGMALRVSKGQVGNIKNLGFL